MTSTEYYERMALIEQQRKADRRTYLISAILFWTGVGIFLAAAAMVENGACRFFFTLLLSACFLGWIVARKRYHDDRLNHMARECRVIETWRESRPGAFPPTNKRYHE